MDGWAIKLFAAVVLTLAGAYVGRACADVRRKRVYQLNQICQAVQRLPVAMLERNMPIEKALSSVDYVGFDAVAKFIKTGRSVEGAWKSAIGGLRDKNGDMCALEDEDIEALNVMFASLGLTKASEQRILISDCFESVDALRTKARLKADDQAKLYSTLGLLAGLAVAILLI